MRKALITMIIVLTALILAIVMFVVGMQLTSEKNASDTGGKEGASSLSDKVESEDGKGESDKPAAAPLDPDYDPLEEPETKEEPEEKPEPEPKPEVEPEQKPDSNSQTTYRDYPANSNEWYRVRTSAGSDGKQDGAFKSFANAKSHADTLKAQGYKVYDNNMKCIYTP